MNIITSFTLSLSFLCECQSGVSALYAAAQNGHDEVVRVLLQSGADHSLQDQVGCLLSCSCRNNDVCNNWNSY